MDPMKEPNLTQLAESLLGECEALILKEKEEADANRQLSHCRNEVSTRKNRIASIRKGMDEILNKLTHQ